MNTPTQPPSVVFSRLATAIAQAIPVAQDGDTRRSRTIAAAVSKLDIRPWCRFQLSRIAMSRPEPEGGDSVSSILAVMDDLLEQEQASLVAINEALEQAWHAAYPPSTFDEELQPTTTPQDVEAKQEGTDTSSFSVSGSTRTRLK